ASIAWPCCSLTPPASATSSSSRCSSPRPVRRSRMPLSAQRQTRPRWGLVGSGAALVAGGAALLAWALTAPGAWPQAAAGLGGAGVGLGPLLQLLLGAGVLAGVGSGAPLQPLVAPAILALGALGTLAGWMMVGLGLQHVPASEERSPSAGAPLYG